VNTPDRTVLLVVDVQVDFLPGGALGIPGGDRILAPLAALMRSGVFRNIVATQDWHPPAHVSFATSHAGRHPFETVPLDGYEQMLWPDHVAGSPGAELHPAVPWQLARAIVRKGTDAAVDSYSAFRNNCDAHGARPPTGLAGYLRDCGIEDVYVCGLARDYCVRASAIDAAELGFRTSVILDRFEPVSAANDEPCDRVHGAGIEISIPRCSPLTRGRLSRHDLIRSSANSAVHWSEGDARS
jgi:nicotinamidase/pyrazinamidase